MSRGWCLGDTRNWWIKQWMAVRALPPEQIETLTITVEDVAKHTVVKLEQRVRERARKAFERPQQAARNTGSSGVPRSD